MPQTLVAPGERTERLTSLYRLVQEMEHALWSTLKTDPFAEMTPEQTQAYNGLLRQLREAEAEIPALRGAAPEMRVEALVSEAHAALRTGVLPVFEEALPS